MLPHEPPAGEPQSAGAVLMVRPASFAFNPQTASSNSFQRPAAADGGHAAAQAAQEQEGALREFERMADLLARTRVDIVVAEDSVAPAKPDAIFPNNWVSFHRDGTVVLYPMLAPNRRLERREEVLLQVARRGFRASRTVDLSHREHADKFLEGTGSLVLDRVQRVAYACLSPRTDLDVLGEFAQRLDYELVTFAAFAAGVAIYHTNVLMAVGARFAVLCAAAISDSSHRTAVENALRSSGHEILEISPQQMQSFAGNLLELATPGGNVIALSHTAWLSLAPAQRRILERHGTPVIIPIPGIERAGGGGVRCMMAEIHLPRADAPRPGAVMS